MSDGISSSPTALERAAASSRSPGLTQPSRRIIAYRSIRFLSGGGRKSDHNLREPVRTPPAAIVDDPDAQPWDGRVPHLRRRRQGQRLRRRLARALEPAGCCGGSGRSVSVATAGAAAGGAVFGRLAVGDLEAVAAPARLNDVRVLDLEAGLL